MLDALLHRQNYPRSPLPPLDEETLLVEQEADTAWQEQQTKHTDSWLKQHRNTIASSTLLATTTGAGLGGLWHLGDAVHVSSKETGGQKASFQTRSGFAQGFQVEKKPPLAPWQEHLIFSTKQGQAKDFLPKQESTYSSQQGREHTFSEGSSSDQLQLLPDGSLRKRRVMHLKDATGTPLGRFENERSYDALGALQQASIQLFPPEKAPPLWSFQLQRKTDAETSEAFDFTWFKEGRSQGVLPLKTEQLQELHPDTNQPYGPIENVLYAEITNDAKANPAQAEAFKTFSTLADAQRQGLCDVGSGLTFKHQPPQANKPDSMLLRFSQRAVSLEEGILQTFEEGVEEVTRRVKRHRFQSIVSLASLGGLGSLGIWIYKWRQSQKALKRKEAN